MTTTENRDASARKLRILLIAYEFPPSPSPQSLRWAYLTGRLAELGHEVHVMAPNIPGTFLGLPEQHPEVQLHRVYPGPVRAFLGWLALRRPLSAAAEQTKQPSTSVDETVVAPPRLNWKGRLLERFQHVISWMIFPDLRGEWLEPALKALPGVLDQVSPDVVVSSHEPATTLQLGLIAKRSGYPWVADLGDPVLAAYTLPRWRTRAKTLEEATLLQADHVLVTAAKTAETLRIRHQAGAPISVLEQGFDERVPAEPDHAGPTNAPLELLYSGRFYSFRDPSVLVQAVVAVTGIRLSIASANVPDWLFAKASAHPQCLRLLGPVRHRELLHMQRRADVLVNLANRDSVQVPGKFYEYLGTGRPILHVQAAEPDAAGVLLGTLRRGWSVPGTTEAILDALTGLRLQHQAGELYAGLDLSLTAVAQWSWSAAAVRLEATLRDVVSLADRP